MNIPIKRKTKAIKSPSINDSKPGVMVKIPFFDSDIKKHSIILVSPTKKKKNSEDQTDSVGSESSKMVNINSSEESDKKTGNRKEPKRNKSPRKYKKSNKNIYCISCKTKDTPCWRRSWYPKQKLCNTCGLRFKKVFLYCQKCNYIPMKNEINEKNRTFVCFKCV